jgi:hypothetical protein
MIGKSTFAQSCHLGTECLLGALAQKGVVGKDLLSTEVYAVTCTMNIPTLINTQLPVSSQVHDCKLRHEA